MNATSHQASIDRYANSLQESGWTESTFLPGGEELLASLLVRAARDIGARTTRIIINYDRGGSGYMICLIDGAIR